MNGMTETAIPDEIRAMSFEDAMAELELIVRRLEEGKGKLDDAIVSYERGTFLRRHCEAKLAQAQSKIDRIVAGSDGSVTTVPFEPS